MYTNIAYLAQSYFHQDFQDEADEPIEIVEMLRDNEPADVTEALRAEILALLESGATDEELSRIWLADSGAYYDPAFDGITVRDWLTSAAEALAPATPAGPDPGIPVKGTPPS